VSSEAVFHFICDFDLYLSISNCNLSFVKKFRWMI